MSVHELSLCRCALNIIMEQALVQNYRHIKKVYFEIGALANVEKSAFALSFEVIARNTLVEGAEIEFIDVAGTAVCRNCHRTVPVYQWLDACALCGYHQLDIRSGTEFRIKSLEME